MPSLSELIQKYSRFYAAITNALETEVAEVMKTAVTDAALLRVYEVYSPEFLSRRDPMYGGGETRASRAGGGITDRESVNITVSGTELTASDDAGWQHLWGGQYPSGRLADAIATGDPSFNMGRAGPRPFHDTAERIAIDSGAVSQALQAGLNRQGFDVSGGTINIT